MDSLSFDNSRHVLVLACTIVLANVLFVSIPHSGEAIPDKSYSVTSQRLEVIWTSQDSSSMVTRLTPPGIKSKAERTCPDHPVIDAVKSLTGIIICSRTINHY